MWSMINASEVAGNKHVNIQVKQKERRHRMSTFGEGMTLQIWSYKILVCPLLLSATIQGEAICNAKFRLEEISLIMAKPDNVGCRKWQVLSHDNSGQQVRPRNTRDALKCPKIKPSMSEMFCPHRWIPQNSPSVDCKHGRVEKKGLMLLLPTGGTMELRKGRSCFYFLL